MKKKILSFLAAALLLACLPLHAFAHEVPDMDRQGSIEITMKYGDKAVSGGTLTATKVGKVEEEDGNYFFVRLDGEPLTDITSPDAPKELETFAKEYGKKNQRYTPYGAFKQCNYIFKKRNIKLCIDTYGNHNKRPCNTS